MKPIEAKAKLLELLKDDTIIYTSLVSVARSGMTRRIKCYIVKDNEINNISFFVARFLEWSLNDKGIKVEGCGMDMGFHTVNNLSIGLKLKLVQQWL
jgi:hypothetical protein